MKHAADVTAMVNEKTAPRAAARRAEERRRDTLKMTRIAIVCAIMAAGFPVLYKVDLIHKYLAMPVALIGLIGLTFCLGAYIQRVLPERGVFRG